LDIMVQVEAGKSCIRLRDTGQWGRWPDPVGHCAISDWLGREIPLLLSRSDRMAPRRVTEKRFRVEISSEESTGEGRILCFTDGSRMAGTGYSGAGILVEGEGGEEGRERALSLGVWATVFQAEVRAILECVRMVEEMGIRGGITICSDSQAAIKALAARRVCSRLVLECRRELDKAGRSREVVLRWVRGHSGVEGNERADALARRGAEMAPVGQEPVVGLAWATCVTLLKEWGRGTHATRWRELEDCRQSRELMRGPQGTLAREVEGWGRSGLRVLVGALTGHNMLRRHAHRMGLAEESSCRRCGRAEETSYHVLGECEGYARLRWEVFGRDVLTRADIRTAKVGMLWRFVKGAGVFF